MTPVGPLAVSLRTVVESHRVLVLALLLLAIFMYGWLESAVFKRPDWACASWIMGLLMLTGWIVYPGTTLRIGAGAVVFLSGLIGMIAYYRARRRSA